MMMYHKESTFSIPFCRNLGRGFYVSFFFVILTKIIAEFQNSRVPKKRSEDLALVASCCWLLLGIASDVKEKDSSSFFRII